jgi:hypothetical protein
MDYQKPHLGRGVVYLLAEQCYDLGFGGGCFRQPRFWTVLVGQVSILESLGEISLDEKLKPLINAMALIAFLARRARS